MNSQRDYNGEIRDNQGRRYAYNFDFDVMHPYMIKSFEPFFRQGSLLELGSFKGDFTRRFLPYFSDITCVEASGDALSEAREKLGDRVMGETGSFRDDYLDDFRALLKTDEIPVERFDWSSGNDHFARAEAAVRLFNRLTDLPIDPSSDRLLLWGHSHASNVFALLTNLVANDRGAIDALFAAE